MSLFAVSLLLRFLFTLVLIATYDVIFRLTTVDRGLLDSQVATDRFPDGALDAARTTLSAYHLNGDSPLLPLICVILFALLWVRPIASLWPRRRARQDVRPPI